MSKILVTGGAGFVGTNFIIQRQKLGHDVKPKFVLNQKGNYKETLRESDEAINLLAWKPKDRLQDYILNLKND